MNSALGVDIHFRKCRLFRLSLPVGFPPSSSDTSNAQDAASGV